MQKLQSEVDELKDDIEEAQKQHHRLKVQRDSKSDTRKEMWRRTSESRPAAETLNPSVLVVNQVRINCRMN